MMEGHIKIGTHEYTSLQKRLLQVADIDPTPIVTFKTVSDPEVIVELSKNTGAPIIIQNLQSHKIIWIWKTASKENIPVYMFTIDKLGYITENECPQDADIRVPLGDGRIKCGKTRNLTLIEEVEIKTQPVAVTVPGGKTVVKVMQG